jgi:GT2 family glycosyltransferase
MEPLVYIILLNWHGWRDTIECLNSLGGLSYQNYRVLVVDNGSTDDSVLQLKTAYPNLNLIETGSNLGFSGGCNVGIRYALKNNATYVWLLNNDTKVGRHSLSRLVDLGNSDENIGAVGSVLYHMDQPSSIQVWGGGRVYLWLGTARGNLQRTPEEKMHYVSGASMLLRCEALRTVGLLDELIFFLYWEDVDLCFRLRAHGWRLTIAEDSHVWHKESAGLGKGSTSLDIYMNASAVLFFKRYAPLPIFPILIGTGVRLIKRLLRGDWEHVRAVWQGASSKLCKPVSRK